jgi:hypothetical protein
MTVANGARRQLTARTRASLFCGAGCSGRSFLLVSVGGGAVVAMLTFVGNLWTRDDELSLETLLSIQFC